jgi:hypothetical protein
VDAIIQIFKDSKGKYRFKLVNTTGEIMATSASYASKETALKGIENVKKNASLTIIEDLTL